MKNNEDSFNDIKTIQTLEYTLLLSILGTFFSLFTTILIINALHPFISSKLWFYLWGAIALFFVGFIFRVIRRKVFFGKFITIHQAFSFEALFQGATFLYPQLPFPSIEASFIKRETQLTLERASSWAYLRITSAVAIPLILITAICFLTDYKISSISLLLIVFLFIFYRSFILERKTNNEFWRYLFAVIFGILAALGEGLIFSTLAHTIIPSIPYWECFLLYSVTLVCFELSPIPLALGIIEIVYLFVFYYWLEFPIEGILVPFIYRLIRIIPVIALMLFYLPRYKFRLVDIYNPSLSYRLIPHWISPTRQQREFLNSDRISLSVVIPAYNEINRLPNYLIKVAEFCSSNIKNSEIIVVDDGSTDTTIDYVKTLLGKYPHLKIVQNQKNEGKGVTVKRGVLEAKGEYILFADADGSTPIEETLNLLEYAKKGADVVIASRQKDVQRSILRGLLGTVFYRLTNLLAVPGIKDTQCGFKLFHYDAAKKLFSLSLERGWAFDVEVLFLAQKLGMNIVEVPVVWNAVEGSKVNTFKDSILMFIALLRIRRRWKGITMQEQL